MRYRGYFFLALLAAAPACTAGVDGPNAVKTGDGLFDAGVKPPPPIGSQDVDIDLSSPSSETPSVDLLSAGGPGAVSSFDNQPFFARVHGRYFSNSQFTNGWIQFVSDECTVASADAMLRYNEKTGTTNGHGTLTNCDGVTLDLSKIHITGGGFGNCELIEGEYSCRSFSFSYNGIPGGSVFIGPSD